MRLLDPFGKSNAKNPRTGSGGTSEGPILVGDMAGRRRDLVRIKECGAGLAEEGAGETNTARRAGKICQERGFVESLKVDGASVASGAQFAHSDRETFPRAAIEPNDFVKIAAGDQDVGPAAVHKPIDLRPWKRTAEHGGGRCAKNDIPK